jgi:hypothetical protein
VHLPLDAAAIEAQRRQFTGVALKDGSDDVPLLVQAPDPG